MATRMMRLLDNPQYKAAINRHIHHDAYKVLAVLIPDSVQQLPAVIVGIVDVQGIHLTVLWN